MSKLKIAFSLIPYIPCQEFFLHFCILAGIYIFVPMPWIFFSSSFFFAMLPYILKLFFHTSLFSYCLYLTPFFANLFVKILASIFFLPSQSLFLLYGYLSFLFTLMISLTTNNSHLNSSVCGLVFFFFLIPPAEYPTI